MPIPLPAWTAKAAAFVRRDLKTEVSYRLSFVSEIAGIVFSLALFYFLARLVGPSAEPRMAAYGGDYFAFVLVGIAFYRYLSVALAAFSQAVSQGQAAGTLEAMLVSPTHPLALLLHSSLWPFLRATLEVGVYLAAGALLFGFRSEHADLGAAALTLVLTVLAFSSFGILSAAFVLVFKRGDPFAFVLGTLSALLGGVYYPVEVLPSWLRHAADLVPLTYALRGLRRAILGGASAAQILPDLGVLALFAAAGLPLSLWVFGRAMDRAKRDGTLAHA